MFCSIKQMLYRPTFQLRCESGFVDRLPLRPIAANQTWSVCALDALVSPGKADESIEMHFRMWTRPGQGNFVFD